MNYLRKPAGDHLKAMVALQRTAAEIEALAALYAWDSFEMRRPRQVMREAARIAEAMRRLLELTPEANLTALDIARTIAETYLGRPCEDEYLTGNCTGGHRWLECADAVLGSAIAMQPR
jgi:hypothetical protein